MGRGCGDAAAVGAPADPPMDSAVLLRRRSPSDASGAVVCESWVVRAAECPTAVEGLLADASIQIYLNLGPTGRHVSDGRREPAVAPRAAWVVGPRTGRLDVTKEVRDSHIVGVKLRPGVARAVLGVSPAELTDSLEDLELFWRGDVQRIRESMERTADPEQRMAIVEQELLRRVLRCHGSGDRRTVDRISAGLSADRPETVASIAERLGLSHRRVIRLLRDHVGLRPAQFRRVQRFRKALGAISSDASAWSTVAHRAGYSDQSHMIREFGRLAGMTPVDYLERRSPVGEGFVRLVMAG